MAQPTASDVHVDVPLSNVSIAYRNPLVDYIADAIFPMIRVDKQSDKYFIWTKDFWFRLYVQQRTPGAPYPEGALELSNTNYNADIFHLGYPLPDEIIKNQDTAIDLERTAAEWLGDQFMLNRESKMVADFFKTGVWATDRTLTAAQQWSNYDDPASDPIGHVQTGKQTVKKATGATPNTLVIGSEVLDTLERHPQLLEIYKHTSVPILSKEQIAAALKVDRIEVGNAVENTANEGATFSGSFMWGKKAMLLYITPTPGLMTPNAGYTFVWPIDNGGLDVQVSTIREDSRDRDFLKAKHAFDQKAVATDLGYFIESVVA